MAFPHTQLSCNDGVLVISLLYLGIDMQYEWEEFSKCRWPIHRWLLVSYVFVILFRLMHILGMLNTATDAGDFLLNFRHKGVVARALVSLTWLIVLPLFTAWTVLGTCWLVDSKRASRRCLPMGVPLGFILTWQVLSYAWICIHAGLGATAWILERRLRKVEISLREIEDADVLSRWGQVSRLPGYTSLNGTSFGTGGLTPLEINDLPIMRAAIPELGEDTECPICLYELKPGDNVRQLSMCGHTFHRSCIDLWLLRRADCPLCKRSVRSAAGGGDGKVGAASGV